MARTWILTGSPENYAATEAHGFSVIGLKIRPVSDHNAEVLLDRSTVAAGAPAMR